MNRSKRDCGIVGGVCMCERVCVSVCGCECAGVCDGEREREKPLRVGKIPFYFEGEIRFLFTDKKIS